MQQIVDLHEDGSWQDLGVTLVSISPDPLDAWREATEGLRVEGPFLSDTGNRVASRYGVMRWGMPSGEPGHTFVLVGDDGRLRWIGDYGAPEHGGLMYVSPGDLVPEVASRL